MLRGLFIVEAFQQGNQLIFVPGPNGIAVSEDEAQVFLRDYLDAYGSELKDYAFHGCVGIGCENTITRTIKIPASIKKIDKSRMMTYHLNLYLPNRGVLSVESVIFEGFG